MAAAALSGDVSAKLNIEAPVTPVKAVPSTPKRAAATAAKPAVQVAVRIRPMLPSEEASGAASVFTAEE